MFEILIAYCLIDAPGLCREHSVAVPEQPSLFACVTGGQLMAVQWIETHPNYKLKAWRCQPLRAKA